MLRKIIILFFITLLCIPLLELQFDFVKETPLKGAYYTVADKEFSYEDWFSSDYQAKKELYLKNILGFKPFLTRLNNQIDFSIFKVTHARGIVAGKNDILYQDMYIDAYYGEDYIGHDSLNAKISAFKILQDQLSDKDIDLYLVIAPGKASMFPESIPDQLKAEMDTTNYEKAISLLDKYGCKYLNLREYFLDIKDTSRFPLFPNHGIHWSGYGITLATDTVVKYLEKNSNVQLTPYTNNKGEMSTNYRFTDNDIGLALNLMLNNTDQKLYYPEVVFGDSKPDTSKPNMLAIGDSFTQSFWRFYPYFDSLFSEKSRFFYYNKHIGWPKKYSGIKVADMDFYDEVTSRDIILIVSTEQNLKQFGFGFVEMALDIINNKEELAKAKLKYYINSTRQDSEKMKSIESKAEQRGISIDSMLFVDAKLLCRHYLIDFYIDEYKSNSDSLDKLKSYSAIENITIDSLIHRMAVEKTSLWIDNIDPNKYLLDEEVRSTMITIKSIPKWYRKVVEKAKNKGVSAEYQLMIEAKYVISNKND